MRKIILLAALIFAACLFVVADEIAIQDNGSPVLVHPDGTMSPLADGESLSYSAADGWVLHRPDGSSQAVASIGAEDDSLIRIGCVLPLSGAAAQFGTSAERGMDLALSEWNAAGGLFGKQVRLIARDDQGDPSVGAGATAKLIKQDRVSLVLGAVMSKVSLAAGALCQAAKIPMISPTSTNPKVTQLGDYVFRACFIDPVQGIYAANFAYRALRLRKAACLFDADNDYTSGLSEKFRDRFEALGGKVVAYSGHDTGITDFSDQISLILAGKPELVYCSDYYNDAALVAKQLRAKGYTGPIMGGDGWDSPDLVAMGGSAVEGCYFTNHYSADMPNQRNKDFVARYTATYGSQPDAIAALGYDVAIIALEAAKSAGSLDGAALRDAIAKTNLDLVTGHLRFGPDRNPIKTAVVIRIVNGKQTLYTTIDAD